MARKKKNQKLRVGIVGTGVGITHIHAFQNLPGLFEVVAICATKEEKTRDIAERFGIPRYSVDINELYEMDDLDVIDLCTPSHLHVEQVLKTLAADKHVICEKPVAGSIKGVDDLIQAEAASDKRVMPIFQYRFGNGLQRLKFLVEEGVAGRACLTTVETAWRRRADYYETWHGRWDTELGGPLVTLAVHAHDVLTYVLGPVKRVMAHTKTLVNPIETEDTVSAALEMADGSLASLSVTTGSSEQITRHRFCFSNLTAESNLQPYRNTTDPWTFTGDSAEVERQIEETLSNFVPLPEDFAGQFYRFYQALQNDTELPVTLDDARASLELITAIYHSAETGQAVDLPIGKDHLKYANYRPQWAYNLSKNPVA
ncbi:MAG: Gfo/Idh/MocA family oxidoreductase [Anaerolineae bacterium]|nr:Gfo/Idh/MocA family oxidoreductase [Anaerolineae bacterium]